MQVGDTPVGSTDFKIQARSQEPAQRSLCVSWPRHCRSSMVSLTSHLCMRTQIIPEEAVSPEQSSVRVVRDCDVDCTTGVTSLEAGAPYELVVDAKDRFGNSRPVGKDHCPCCPTPSASTWGRLLAP